MIMSGRSVNLLTLFLGRLRPGHNARITYKKNRHNRHNSNITNQKKCIKNNQEETKQKSRLGMASNETTGGLQLVCG